LFNRRWRNDCNNSSQYKETTVTIPPNTRIGRGGRNLELALNAVRILDGISNAVLITLATDGEDGTTDAAGAVVTGESFRKGKESQMHLDQGIPDAFGYLPRKP